MRFTPAFYRAAALCSIASALTTLGLIFLPGMLAPADDFAARMDWTVQDYANSNHAPLLVVNGAAGTAPLFLDATLGKPLTLDANGTRGAGTLYARDIRVKAEEDCMSFDAKGGKRVEHCLTDARLADAVIDAGRRQHGRRQAEPAQDIDPTEAGAQFLHA